ncbi:MAG: alpha/beta hydrolase [Planctomycetes bacterium]|jgi:pimeloyl-ACP methyl ester carboxylesterase|nr:alpha/beta hydrolase [Planctomycetota bacterium]
MPEFKHVDRAIYYDAVGAGPVVVFQHGLGGDRRQALAALGGLTGYRVVAMDAPGHGETCGELGTASFQSFADCVLGLLDHLGIESAAVGGISMGSGIALALALRTPDRVRSLMLVRPAWLAGRRPRNLDLVARLGHWIEDDGLDAARVKLEVDSFYLEMLRTDPACAASLAAVLERPQALDAAEVLYRMVDDRPFGAMDEMAEIRCPTLVIANEGDPVHPLPLGVKLSQAIDEAQLEVIPPRYAQASAHQAALTQALQGFLDQHSG